MITLGNYNRKEAVKDKFRSDLRRNTILKSVKKSTKKLAHHFFTAVYASIPTADFSPTASGCISVENTMQ